MRILGVLILALGIMLTSCSKEEWTATDNFVSETYQEMRDGHIGGHHRCYRVNWPITIIFPDDMTQEVDSRQAFILALKDWREDNPDAEERPTLEFPFTITRIDGEEIEVTSEEQIKELRRKCIQHKNAHRKCRYLARFLNNKCFKVSLPVTLVTSEGEITTIENRADLLRLLKEWKEDRPDEVPEFSFPITVTIKDTDEVVEIVDQAAFDAMVAECDE